MLQMQGHFLFIVFPAMSIKLQFFVFHIIVQTFPDSQTETDIVTKMDETKERWKIKVLPDDVSTNEPWEEEVEDLVAWTNTLDTDALED